MKIRKIRQDVLRFAGHNFASVLVTLLCKSLRVNFQNRETITELEKNNKNYVLAFWHGTMILPWFLHGRKECAALISKSKDGDLLARILKKWNYTVVRGSSSSGGAIALGIMIDYAKNKYSVAVTPDGPRGPIHKFKAGAAITAKKSNVPLVLAGVGFEKKRILKNWDRFEVPLPFSRAKIIYSDQIFIDKNMQYEETNRIIEECEKQLNSLQYEAAKFSV